LREELPIEAVADTIEDVYGGQPAWAELTAGDTRSPGAPRARRAKVYAPTSTRITTR